MAIQATDVQDILNTTLNKYGKLKITDLMSDYNNTYAVKRTMKKNKMTFDAGPEVEFNLLTDTNGSARFVGTGATDVVDIPNVTTRGKVGWKRVTWNWAMDGTLISMNSGSAEKIFDIVQSQRLAATGSFIALMEQRFWRAPSSTDTVNPFGVPYWIVKNNTPGFNGTVPSGFTVVGNVNPTTYTRWRNYTDQYTNITASDFVDKARTAMWETDFELLVDEIPDYNTGDDYGIYTNWTGRKGVEDIATSQNDNLGFDIDPSNNKATFRRRPIYAVRELVDDTTNPFYFINWGEFKTIGLKGWWMKETVIPVKSDQHTIACTHMDCVFNWLCRNRRRNAVLATDTTMPA